MENINNTDNTKLYNGITSDTGKLSDQEISFDKGISSENIISSGKGILFGKEMSSLILLILLIVLSFISLFVGVIDIDMGLLISGDSDAWFIFLASRIPRLLSILCTGMGMSVAGLLMQQLCMNKFVSPTTGATISAAELGILLSLVFVPGATIWGRAIFAFILAILGTWIFVWFIGAVKFKDVIMVPLIGIMFNYVIGGITSFIAYRYEMSQSISAWTVGSFSQIIRGRYELVFLCLPLIIIAYVFANHFNIVGMGKDFSKNLGLPYNLILFFGITIAAMITAAVVVTVGSITYIGLVVPNIVAMFKGDRMKGSLIDVALFGALYTLVCDVIGRLVIYPYELPINLVSGVIGSVLFIALLIYRLKKGRRAVRLNDLFSKGRIQGNTAGK